MELASTRITSLVASAALAGGLLAAGAGTAEAGQSGLRSTVALPSSTMRHNPSSTPTVPTDVSPGDVRAWETAHEDAALPLRILPGDLRVWELRHSMPS